MRRVTLALAAAALAGCATAQFSVAPEQAAAVTRGLEGQPRFLRVSMHVTPFFGDATKRLLTPVPPELVRALENPDGSPVNPGPIERTLPVGTPVRVTKLELPSAWVMTERVLYTPRTLAWVYVETEAGAKQALPLVVVLRPGLRTEAELLAEVERHLTREDPTPALEAFPEAVREAVRSKRALVDMPAAALEMAWGFPESKRLEFEGAAKKETWRWAEGQRTATLVDGRVTRFE